jgi:putative sterol carrier protein
MWLEVSVIFPSETWLEALMEKLNSDQQYAEIAKNWEGDLIFEFDSTTDGTAIKDAMYLDLWHGKCRGVRYIRPKEQRPDPKFILTASRDRYVAVLSGKLDPVQALATRRLKVKGNLAYLLRNIPIVLDFVRCARLIDFEA